MDTELPSLPDAKTLFERMCIDGTRFQAHKFISAVESYEGLREAANQGSEIKSNYLPLLSDVFSAFFQNKARLKQNPPRETEENREIMDTALGLKEYEELHTVSRLDFFASAAATRAFSDQIIKLIKEKKRGGPKRAREKQSKERHSGRRSRHPPLGHPKIAQKGTGRGPGGETGGRDLRKSRRRATTDPDNGAVPPC
jgi:hypothetical protein